jgi:hypothetical protein
MSEWMNIDDRRKATAAFSTLLDQNDQERQKCKDDPRYAKDLFMKVGAFTSIPDGVTFSVLEAPQAAGERGDEHVIMALWPKGLLPDPLEPVTVWKCSYVPYVQ